VGKGHNRNLFKNTIIKNISALTLLIAITNILGFVFVIFFSRLLPEAEVGKYYFLFSVFQIVALFGDLGIDTYLLRQWPRESKDEVFKSFNSALSCKVFLALGTGLLFLLFGLLNRDLFLESCIFSAALLLGILKNYVHSYFLSQNKHEYHALVDTIEKVVFVGLGIFLIYQLPLFISMAWAFLISKIYSVIHSYFLYRGPLYWSFNIERALVLIRVSWVFFFITILQSIYYRIDSIMLKYLKDFADVGSYNIPYTLVKVACLIPIIIMSAVFPSMSARFKENPEEAKRLLDKTYYYMVLSVIPITIGGLIVGEELIITLFSDQYRSSVGIFRLLLIANFFLFLNYVLLQYLICTDRQKVVFQMIGSLAGANIALNLVFIPLFSGRGAAVATIITEVIQFFLLRKMVLVRLPWPVIIKGLIGGAAMGASVYYLNPILNVFLTIFVGMGIYGGIVYFFKIHRFVEG